MIRLRVSIALLLALNVSYAHHGTSGQFDESKVLEVAGVVTKIRFVNPHSYVYFNVANESGGADEWRCEMRAATLLKRSGWTAEMFAPGTRIKIVGAPARREPHGCYVETIAFDDGDVVERYDQLSTADTAEVVRTERRSDGKPNLAGNWAAPQRLLTNEQVRGIAQGGPEGPAAGRPEGPPGAAAGGPPGGPPRGGARYQQSEAGIKASAGFQREDNPRFHCMPTNILMDWTFDQHINKIEQSDATITLTYGFMDIVRTIHMGMAAHPKSITPSRAGHSIGKWDGDTLVVDTIGFSEGFLDTRTGIKHSSRLHIVERFTFDPKDHSLSREYTGNDPLYLNADFNGQDKIFLTATAFDPYNCEDLTTEIVDGF